MEHVNDQSLLKNIKEGDDKSFRCLFQKYYQPLFLFAKKFVEDENAKDLVQDCFLELWNNREKIEITFSLSAYLFSIVKNRCFKYLKEERQKDERQNKIRLMIKEEELWYFSNSEISILEFDISDRIIKAMEILPGKCKKIFKDSRYSGLSNQEIADKYQISLKGVEKHISKALQIFREEFKDILK